MEIIIILVITAVTAIYIVLPFFLRLRDKKLPEIEVQGQLPVAERLLALNNKKETLYSAIRDIEFDFGLGKLSKEDYDELDSKYKSEAAEVLREIDDIEKETGIMSLDDEIEKEILSHRQSGQSINDHIKREISAFRAVGSGKESCSECGAQYSAEDLFCSKCGAKLK